MCIGEPGRELNGVSNQLCNRQRPAGDAIGQRLTVDELHDDVIEPGVVADIVDGADARVIELRREPRFDVESPARVRIAAHGGAYDLDGHYSPEAGVARSIDLAHAAGRD